MSTMLTGKVRTKLRPEGSALPYADESNLEVRQNNIVGEIQGDPFPGSATNPAKNARWVRTPDMLVGAYWEDELTLEG